MQCIHHAQQGLRGAPGGGRAAPSHSTRQGLRSGGGLRCRALASSSSSAVGFGHRQQQHQQQRQPLQQQQQQRPQAGGSSVVARPPTSGRTAPRQRHGSVQARALAATGIVPLGYDFLTFLTATVLVVPSCKFLKISPVLGFLAAGLALEQAGMLKDLTDMETLSELGVLFLLYEQGLELSFDRLKALARYAFGMGSLQVIITTLLFTAFALPAGSGVGTWFLEKVCHADPALVSIRTVDEAVVIAAALSMSSSAFVLQLLGERGESATRTGSATLGILLFQDIAIVPFLVLLPLIESNGGMEGASADTLLKMLGPTAATTMAGLGALLLGGRVVLRRVFEIVANSRSSEAFVAACLLTVGGSSLLTKQLGLSDTLGAFVAGVLLSETSFRTQVEADIRPFRGLLIGLFFLSVGGSINMTVLRDNWDIIAWMLAGLVSLKAGVNIMLGPLFGLTRSESIRTGFLLSQGGEFAFVLLSLACQLKVLPEELNQILIIIVVASMALTPTLADVGSRLADAVEAAERATTSDDELSGRVAPVLDVEEPVVILGFGAQGQMVANMLSSPLAAATQPYIGFDLDPARVSASQQAGFNVAYGDGSRADVLKAAGVKRPAAVVVCHSIANMSTKAVESIRAAFSSVPIYACATSFKHAAELKEAGADKTIVVSSEAGLNLGSRLLQDLGTPESAIALLRRGIGEALAVRTAAELTHPSSSSSSSSSGNSTSGLKLPALKLPSLSSASSSSSSSAAGRGSSSSSSASDASEAAGCEAPAGSHSNGSAHAMSSAMGSAEESSSSSGGSGGGGKAGDRKKRSKKPRPELEMFVLDGRYVYGLNAPPPLPLATPEGFEGPCTDCPRISAALNGGLEPAPAAVQPAAAAAAAAAATASGGSADSSVAETAAPGGPKS